MGSYRNEKRIWNSDLPQFSLLEHARVDLMRFSRKNLVVCRNKNDYELLTAQSSIAENFRSGGLTSDIILFMFIFRLV